MHKELTGTDIRYIARGCWNNHFNWRFLPKVKTAWFIALITFVVGIALVFANTEGPAAVDVIAALLVFTAGGFLIKGVWDIGKSRDDFVDMVVEEWEKGNKEIPDADLLKGYLNGKD